MAPKRPCGRASIARFLRVSRWYMSRTTGTRYSPQAAGRDARLGDNPVSQFGPSGPNGPASHGRAHQTEKDLHRVSRDSAFMGTPKGTLIRDDLH